MKTYFLTVLFAALCVPWNAGYAGQVNACLMTQSKFAKICTDGQQCCPNGDYVLNYSCPLWWTASGTTCRRNGTSGSDDTGYYTQNYGTCAASSTRIDCCNVSTGSSISCISCWGGVL